MKINEFIEEIESGGDIMFDCCGKHYTICAWDGEPIDIAEQKTGKNHERFETARDLVENYLIEKKVIKDRIRDVVITFRS